jgi:two-component system, OmpR family, alkaline phosphatase synthesis response regulator PhoP
MENIEYKILLVDDEPDILEFLGYNLVKEGYQIFKANNGKTAISAAIEIKPHLIVLDVMMPEIDGIETCHELRKISELKNCIIVFLTARSEDYSQIAGFDAGADDYISKPIKPKVFVSKVKALLRRYNNAETISDRIILDNIIIDRERYAIYINGKEYKLPRKEFELLSLLASKPNKVFTRDEIFNTIWGKNTIVGDRTIDVHIRKIREQLEIDNIKTIKGIGYKYEF